MGPDPREGSLGLFFRLNQTFTSALESSSSQEFRRLAAFVIGEVSTLLFTSLTFLPSFFYLLVFIRTHEYIWRYQRLAVTWIKLCRPVHRVKSCVQHKNIYLWKCKLFSRLIQHAGHALDPGTSAVSLRHSGASKSKTLLDDVFVAILKNLLISLSLQEWISYCQHDPCVWK